MIIAILSLIAWFIIRRIMKRMPAHATPVVGATFVNPAKTGSMPIV